MVTGQRVCHFIHDHLNNASDSSQIVFNKPFGKINHISWILCIYRYSYWDGNFTWLAWEILPILVWVVLKLIVRV